jgi:hypothetical protein
MGEIASDVEAHRLLSPAQQSTAQPRGSLAHLAEHIRVLRTKPLEAVLDRAGARRIRFVESCWASAGPLEEYMLDSGWNVRQLQSLSPRIEFENTNALGRGKRYVRFKVPGGGLVFPSYDLNQAYDETDVFVSLAKLKEHATCGVTLSMKNIFGITPASIYGDDAGRDAPNESPTKGRVKVCHLGERQPAAIAAPERDPASSRVPEQRMPRITAAGTNPEKLGEAAARLVLERGGPHDEGCTDLMLPAQLFVGDTTGPAA